LRGIRNQKYFPAGQHHTEIVSEAGTLLYHDKTNVFDRKDNIKGRCEEQKQRKAIPVQLCEVESQKSLIGPAEMTHTQATRRCGLHARRRMQEAVDQPGCL